MPQGTDFPAMEAEVVANLEPKIEQTLIKKKLKIIDFLITSLMRKIIENGPQILKNRPQDGSKSLAEESRSKKQEKCKNEQRSIVFDTFLLSAGVENPTKFFKKWCRKRVENQVRF